MAESVSKKKSHAAAAAAAAKPDPTAPVEKLILDRKFGKYKIVHLISFWAKELRKKEEHRHLNQTELLELAMAEVLGGKVDEDELRKLEETSRSSAEAPGKEEKEKKG